MALVFFYSVIYGVGRVAARRHSAGTVDDLILARRSMPLWLGVFPMSATWVGGGYINGTAEATYGLGLVWAPPVLEPKCLDLGSLESGVDSGRL